MSMIHLDLNTLESTRATMSSLCDELGTEAGVQSQLASRCEWALRNLAPFILPLVQAGQFVDIGSHWWSSELPQVSGQCAQHHEKVHALRRSAKSAVDELAQSHGVSVGSALAHQWEYADARWNDAISTTQAAINDFQPGNLLALISDPWRLTEQLSSGASLLRSASYAVREFAGFLQRVQRGEEAVLQLLAAHVAGEAQAVSNVMDIREGIMAARELAKGAKGVVESGDAVPVVGFMLSLGLELLADPPRSPHDVGRIVYGQVGETAAAATLYGAIAIGALVTVQVGATVDGGVLTTVGERQGGVLGQSLVSAGKNWYAVASDASSALSIFNDVGAIMLDTHAGTVLSYAAGNEALAPVMFHAELMAGSDPGLLGGDFGQLGSDLWKAGHLPLDLVIAHQETKFAMSGEIGHFAAQLVAPRICQPVDSAIYYSVAALL